MKEGLKRTGVRGDGEGSDWVENGGSVPIAGLKATKIWMRKQRKKVHYDKTADD